MKSHNMLVRNVLEKAQSYWQVRRAFLRDVAAQQVVRFRRQESLNSGINPLFLVANLPWLLFTWLVWWVQQKLSREPAAHHLGDSGWTIGAYPGRGYPANRYDLVVDLTAEFPAPRAVDAAYVALPNLDAVALNHPPDVALLHQLGISPHSRVFVHCAQGHGRSATWCAAAFTAMGRFNSASQAHAWILSFRPRAKLSYSQRKQLQTLDGAEAA